MDKTFFIVSDIEMGQGDVMDDFSDDDTLVQFIDGIDQTDQETTLVLNGDIFDFLKMDYHGEHTRYITEEVSTWKLERVFESHPKVFLALKSFLKKENHQVFFVIGNHDFDLIWPSLQDTIRAHLGHGERIQFDFHFEYETLHAEHGNFLDPFFQNDRKRPFVSFRGQKILNLPIGCHVVFSHLAPFKRKYPKEEQLYPRGKLKELHPEYSHEIKKLFWMYAWKVAIDPLIHFTDPTYRVGYLPFIRHFFRYGLDFVNDEKFLPDRLHDIGRQYPQKKVFALAHTHVFLELLHGSRHFLATDTWRNEYDLSDPTHAKKPKSYAEIIYNGGELKEAQLKIYNPENRDVSPRQHQSLAGDKVSSKKSELGKSQKYINHFPNAL